MKLRNQLVVLVLLMMIGALPLCAASATLNPGTRLHVRITERLSSETAKTGDTFHGTLAEPVMVNGKVMFDRGTEVKGEVIQASKSGRLSSPGQLQLVLTSISGGWFRSYPLTVQPLIIRGGSHTRSNVAKIGGGAAAGAIVGGAAAGGKGAAIGAGVGAGSGTVIAAATGKHEAIVESEALLTWTEIDTAAIPGNASDRPSTRDDYRNTDEDRGRDDDRYARRRPSYHHDEDEDDDDDGERREGDRRGDYVFSAHDRVVLRGCLADNYSNLPPGLAKRNSLPPGLEKQLQRNGTLPPGLQKRVQPLPEACEVRLPRLPHDWERVVLGGSIILLDAERTIRDIFELSERD